MKTTTNETCMNRYKINGHHYFARDEETAILQFKCDYQFRNEERTPKPHPTTPKVELIETEITLQPYATQLCDEHRETLNAAIVEMNAVMRMPKNKRGTFADHIFQVGGYDFLLVADDTLSTWEQPVHIVEGENGDGDVHWYSPNFDAPFPCLKTRRGWGKSHPLLYFVDRSKGLLREVAELETTVDKGKGKDVAKIDVLDSLPEGFCVAQERRNRSFFSPVSTYYANYVANFELSSFLENAEVELQDLHSVLEKECA